MKKIMKNEKGFTLIELIIVIAILAIIAAVAIPNILNAVDNSRKSADVANAKIILNAAAQVNAKNSNAAPLAGDYTLSTSTTIAFTAATGVTGTPTAFMDQLKIELNNSLPLPKYKAGGATNFVLVVAYDSNGAASLVVETEDGVAVAPTPAAAYDQK